MFRTQDLSAELGGPLTSIMRSLNPSVLGNRTTQTQMPQIPQLPDINDMGGLGSIAKTLFGRYGTEVTGPLSLLGGL